MNMEKFKKKKKTLEKFEQANQIINAWIFFNLYLKKNRFNKFI